MAVWEHIRMGGWAMWPIFALGLVAAGAAARFAWRGEHQLVGFVRWMVLTLIGAGALGFVTGMIRATGIIASRIPREQQLGVLIEATGEALNNVSAALLFAVIVCLLTAVGHRRFPLPNPSAVPR